MTLRNTDPRWLDQSTPALMQQLEHRLDDLLLQHVTLPMAQAVALAALLADRLAPSPAARAGRPRGLE